MKVRNIFKSLLIVILLAASVTGCDYDKELIDELSIEREFAPVGLKAQVRNQVNVELSWTANDNVSSYVVEFSDDPEFSNIVKTLEVASTELPVLIPVESETLYSIRVKAVSDRGLDDSSWATTTAQTLTEQIFIEGEPSDIKALEATLRWVANSEVTEIKVSPGDITHTITDEEKAAGVATISGLTQETEYTATLYNGSKIRGVKMFTTGIDIGTGKLVTTEDDLFQMIADADSGDILVLEGGDYTAQTGTITLDKSITIRGLRNYNKPLLNINFEIVTGAEDVELIDLNLQGNGEGSDSLKDVIRYTAAGNYSSLLISGCEVHDYATSFVAGNETGAILQDLTVENSIVYNIFTGGGDFIDFRNSDVLNVTLKTSTFYNCAVGRDFLRLDDSGTSTQTGLTLNVTIDSCTMYACSTSGKRILYVRFQTNEITVKNTIIAETDGYYSNQSKTDPDPDFVKNNYWNAPGFYDASNTIYDNSSTYFSLDPGFVDPASGDFTITNQSLKDNNVGDPRWR
ncbi:fibronectin type III domain-containing protein [Gillisia sp. M10.2A]|uniref:Fibronectin type III domain-containing protein n=1 Tax=Gillisia lutea TaxID=2909668 RepID=A0ABS9EE45_9FLAO|nr:DUF5123 domain-containing protein [Gillisia lutea]MCF4101053.1 fibronectin type III domain-containing protein [Gillisia lutea]